MSHLWILGAIRVIDSSSTLKTHKPGVTYEPATSALYCEYGMKQISVCEKKKQ